MTAGRMLLPVATLIVAMLLNGCIGILVGGAATGLSVAHDRRTTGTVVDDQTIELKLHSALDQQLPPGNHINISVYNGAVLLSGEVASAQARQQADAIARGIEPPVRTVHNELVIGPPSPLSGRSNDTLLTTQVKAALLRISDIPDFDPTRVKVVTERGVVYLLGLVRPREADAAADVASQVSGVRQVVTLFEYIN